MPGMRDAMADLDLYCHDVTSDAGTYELRFADRTVLRAYWP